MERPKNDIEKRVGGFVGSRRRQEREWGRKGERHSVEGPDEDMTERERVWRDQMKT